MAAKHYDDAVKAYGEALKLVPGDAEATKALNAAKLAAEASKPQPPAKPPAADTQPKPMPKGEAPKPQPPASPPPAPAGQGDAKKTQPPPGNTEFDKHMAEGQKAMTAKRFADAVKEFEAALKLSPNNADAAAALKRAKEGKP
jgi:cytochrome c-type biogenesis protein CcmH/NrfG